MLSVKQDFFGPREEKDFLSRKISYIVVKIFTPQVGPFNMAAILKCDVLPASALTLGALSSISIHLTLSITNPAF